jgi:hypothetical protein
MCLPNDVYIESVKTEIEKGKQVRVKTKGYSMIPFISGDHGEILLKKTDEHSFRKGAILLVQLSAKRFVVHRLYKISGDLLVLKGDGNIHLTEQCTRDQVLAEVIGVVENGRIIREGSFRWNLYAYLWPSSPLLRRIYLGLYKKIRLTHEYKRRIYDPGDGRRVCHGLQRK